MLLSIHCHGGPGGRAAVRFVSIRKPTLQGIVAEFVMKSLNLDITQLGRPMFPTKVKDTGLVTIQHFYLTSRCSLKDC